MHLAILFAAGYGLGFYHGSGDTAVVIRRAAVAGVAIYGATAIYRAVKS